MPEGLAGKASPLSSGRPPLRGPPVPGYFFSHQGSTPKVPFAQLAAALCGTRLERIALQRLRPLSNRTAFVIIPGSVPES